MSWRSLSAAFALVATAAAAESGLCPAVTPVASRWLLTASRAEPIVEMAAVPASLARRVALWERIWGELESGQFLLVDKRRPFIVHAEVDCRGRRGACDDLREHALEQAMTHLRSRSTRDALYGRERALVESARQHMLFLEGRREGLKRALVEGSEVLGAAEAMFTLMRVPRAYARLAVVESMMRSDARSPKGAVGAYQFMPVTASRYLMVREGVDERLDAVRASLAAAKYLKRLKGELGAWPQALTAYNSGASRVRAVMRLHRTRDIGKAIDGGNHEGFGFASQNYYAQVAAIARVTADVHIPRPVTTDVVVRVDKRMHLAELARCVDAESVELAQANPSLTSTIVEGTKPVPKGYLARLSRPPLPVD